MRWTRRDFIKAMMLTAGASSFGSVMMSDMDRVMASSLTPNSPDHRRRFIFCYFNGGWDILLGADPRDPSVFTDEARGNTLIQPAYDRLSAAYNTRGALGNGLLLDPDLGHARVPAPGRRDPARAAPS